MVIMITGATHTGKTRLAQRMMEAYGYPYLSQDHLKMGLIRSGYTDLTPSDDDKMTGFLWPIIREMIKTVIENRQNLIVEGCYIPFDWEADFTPEYRKDIRYLCLCFSDHYVDSHFEEIARHANCIEVRLDDSYCTPDTIKRENHRYAAGCRKHGLNAVMIEDQYEQAVTQVCSLLQKETAQCCMD